MGAYLSTNAIYFVYDNVHDCINEVNLGNGLADLLCHYDEDKELDPDKFIEYANKELEEATSLGEVKTLLCYHHPRYRSIGPIAQLVFHTDISGKISETDPKLLRIIQIRNAYVKAYNDDTDQDEKELTIHQAIDGVTPQLKSLKDENGIFKVSDILDISISIRDDDRKGYPTSAIDNFTALIIGILMAEVNNLYNTLTVKDIELGKEIDLRLIKSDLLDKYFNRDKSYYQSKDTKFYLGGLLQCEHPAIGELTLTDLKDKGIVAAAIEIIQSDFPNENNIKKLARRCMTMYAKHTIKSLAYDRRIQEPYSALEVLNLQLGKSQLANKFFPKQKEKAYGIVPDAFLDLVQLYEIPIDCLNESDKNLLNFNTPNGKKLVEQVEAMREYLNNLVIIHRAYDIALSGYPKGIRSPRKTIRSLNRKRKFGQ